MNPEPRNNYEKLRKKVGTDIHRTLRLHGSAGLNFSRTLAAAIFKQSVLSSRNVTRDKILFSKITMLRKNFK